jgi:hypothetical protein
MSFFPPRWRNKIRRRFYSPYNKLAHRGRYFICRYFGAEFLVRSVNVGGLEISAKTSCAARRRLNRTSSSMSAPILGSTPVFC